MIAATFSSSSTPGMVIVAILVLVLFGWKKLPTFGRSLGRSIGEFRRAKDAFEEELRRSLYAHGPGDKQHRARRKTTRQNSNALVYLMMLISALLLAIGLSRWPG